MLSLLRLKLQGYVHRLPALRRRLQPAAFLQEQARTSDEIHLPDPLSSVTAILDALPDAALIIDDASQVMHGNALARELLGTVRRGEHLSQTTRDPDLATAVAAARGTGRRALFELTVRRPVERRLEGAANRLSIGHPGHEAPAILVVLQDISERDALARMRMEFVANASHELRSPLAALSGFIETLSGSAKDDTVARERFLGIMSEQAARMTRLIDDLLLLSRVEMRAHLEPIAIADLNVVAADAVNQMASTARKDGTRLMCEPLPERAGIRGDHDELVQAVQNLVQNAIKYGRTGGTVIVRVSRGQSGRRQEGELRISVIDDGPGIAAEHVPRLTERFYRVNTAASREKGGTGLGLAIVKHIVTRHHGTIDIATEVGRGTTITLGYPALERQAGLRG